MANLVEKARTGSINSISLPILNMLQIGNFAAWIEMKGVSTPEYNVEISESGKKATCCIASEEGKKFGVHWKDSECSQATGGKVIIDGFRIRGWRTIKPINMIPRDASTCCSSMRVSSHQRRPFVFSKLSTTADDAHLHTASSCEVGQISLEIWSIKCAEDKDRKAFHDFQEQRVHECSKKSDIHRVSLGKARDCHRNGPRERLVDCIEKLATFTFKYRPLALLQADRIAPCQSIDNPQVTGVPVPGGSHSIDSFEESTQEIEFLKEQMQIYQKRIDVLEKARTERVAMEYESLVFNPDEAQAKKRLRRRS